MSRRWKQLGFSSGREGVVGIANEGVMSKQQQQVYKVETEIGGVEKVHGRWKGEEVVRWGAPSAESWR